MKQGHHKIAGILVYLVEELGDARLRCAQLKRYIDHAMQLVEQSEQKSHIHEVAGDLLYGIPDMLFRLDKALDATALAASRLDYEELKQELSPEKVNELEQVLKDVRIRRFDRRAEGDTMNKFATGTDVADALRRVASAIEAEEKQGLNPSASKISNTLLDIAKHVGGEDIRSRFEEGKPADPTDNMSPEDAKEWKAQTEENKDNFKTAASNAKVSTFFAILSSYLTQQDEKESKRERSPNIYRLGLLLQAMQGAEDKLHKYLDRDDSEAMDAMKAVLSRAFNPGFPPLKKILKQIDEWQTSQKLPKLNKI